MVEVREIIPFGGPIEAVVVPPGSKSITNRALLAAALAHGTSTLRGVLFADDTEAMIDCIRALGATVQSGEDATTLLVSGIGGNLSDSESSFFARQSGTTARFLAPVLALSDSPLRLDADDAMRRRPMNDVFTALQGLGVNVTPEDSEGYLPVMIEGPVSVTGEMPAITIDASVSSQFTSGLLLAAPCLPEGLRIEIRGDVVSRPYLEMTVAVMCSFGAGVTQLDEHTFVVAPGGYVATEYDIEPDASAASYFFAAAAICGGTVRVEGLGSESLQGDVRFVDVLAEMGAVVVVSDSSISVTGAPLHGVTADFSQISDTAQTAAAVAVFADGPTTITGIGFIRKKETDRVSAVVAELRRIGVDAAEDADGFTVTPGPTSPGTVETYDDHRMAMSMALIGYARSGISIADPNCVQKTFPTYFDEMERLRPGGSK
ncbi:MAG: 3-phosphoshikimate 1-carboxyvinyltransferase [Actinobacteria bacterium]|uniref:3-phosphoshikimate 1-carboxyvinyltransferase n=1 Tax=freshwater metagenome TaxID=449393 RepID=A0A6J6IJN0_9ZZZZ|nr:3-phosphoshikimate 1-carboxyvinyltransferase [Actinomycetota bacterium]